MNSTFLFKRRVSTVECLIKCIRHPKNFCSTSLNCQCDYYRLCVDGGELSLCQRAQQVEIHHADAGHVATVVEFAGGAVRTWVNTAAVDRILSKITNGCDDAIQ